MKRSISEFQYKLLKKRLQEVYDSGGGTHYDRVEAYAQEVLGVFGMEVVAEAEIENLSREVHKLYCEEYRASKGEEYWTKGNYDLLDEETKEYDRNIARYILEFYNPKTGHR